MEKEPAVTIGAAMTAFAQAVFVLLRASGVEATAELEGGVLALVHALLMFPLIAGILTRFFVFSPATYEEDVNAAFSAGVDQGTWQ